MEKFRKILIVHHSGIISGAGNSLITTLRTLAPTDEITVFVSSDPDDMQKQLESLSREFKNVSIVCYGRRIGALTYYSGGDKLYSPRFIYRMLLIFKQWFYWNRQIRFLAPDIIVTNSIILSWFSLLPEVKKRKSICFVRETIQGTKNSLINIILRKYLCKFTKVSFLSQYDADSWNLPIEKQVVIGNYFDPKILDNTIDKSVASEKLQLKHSTYHVLYVGGVSHMKGFDLVVKAILDSEIPMELIVAGNNFEDRKAMCKGTLPQYESEIFDYINRHKNKDRIHLVGRQMNMSNCYAASDVLVFPMRSPHQARPVYEAGWFSLPVVISDFDNIRESVISNVNGLTFEPNNAKDLICKLEILANNKDFANSLGEKNKDMAIQNHSKDANSSKIINLFHTT